jgi:hypothetical protein
VQRLYAMIGAWFFPVFAATLPRFFLWMAYNGVEAS